MFSLCECLSLCVSTDVYPDSHSDGLHVSQCVRLSWDALHAEGLCHHFPSRTERPEEEEKLQGLNNFTESPVGFCVAVLLVVTVAVLPDSCSVAVLQAVVQAAGVSQKSLNEKQNGEMKIEPDRSQ